MKIVQVERIFYRAGNPVVIRDLKMHICPECGSESMPLISARAVENVLKGQIEPAGEFSAPLYRPPVQIGL